MQCQVIKEYTSHYPNPIKLKKGESISVGARDDEYPGWIRVTTKSGNEGWAPEQYINKDSGQPTATQDYDASELSTTFGETLSVKNIINEWAWVENQFGNCGWVPYKTIEPFKEK